MSQGVEFNRLVLEVCPMQMETMTKTKPIQALAEMGAPSFSGMLSQAVDKVSETRQASTTMANAFGVDQSGVDLTDVMIASQRTSMSLQIMTQVRNKLVQAYQDIMQMPV